MTVLFVNCRKVQLIALFLRPEMVYVADEEAVSRLREWSGASGLT